MTVSPVIARNCLLLCLTATLALADSAFAAHPHAAGDKDEKPGALRLAAPAVAFDCTARDTFVLNPIDAVTHSDATDSLGASLLDGYGCREWAETGPEHIYRLEVESDLELWAGLSDLNGVDLDLILLSHCDTDSCLAMANQEVGALLPAGTYYLIVDGYSRDGELNVGPYTLDITCRWPGVPDAACLVDPDRQITCGTEIINRTGDLFDQPNHVQSFPCSNVVERGGEVWFEVTLPGYHEATADLVQVPETLDAALWVFDGCGPQAQCLDFVDAELMGGPERITIANTAGDPLTVYLAVDSYRPALDEFSGTFVLDFLCQSNVADEKTSLGSFRSFYR